MKVTGLDKSGTAFSSLAHTVDLSAKGVRLAGPLPELALAQQVWVHFQRQKACFEVIRINRTGPITDVGLQLLSGNILWGADFEPGYIDSFEEALKQHA